MKTILSLLALACAFGLGMLVMRLAGPQEQVVGKVQEKMTLAQQVKAVLHLEGKQQKEQLAQLTKDFRDMEDLLIEELDRATTVDQKSATVFLMGWYRCDMCVRELAANVTLQYESKEPNAKLPLWRTYPAVEALTRVGKPAIKPMLGNIESGKSDEFRRLSTETIRRIEGKEVGRFILQQQIKKTRDEIGRKRLEGALEYLESGKR